MEREDLRQIVERYGWGNVVFLDEEPVRENAWVVEPVPSGVRVYLTTERAGALPETVEEFGSEPEALTHVVERLRHRAETRRQLDAVRRRRHLPPAKPALKKLRATIAELRQFLLAHDLRSGVASLGALSDLAEIQDEDPVDVMLAAHRLHRSMLAVPRDGWRDVYVGAASGAADRKASAELERLKARLARILEPWTVEE
jgi:hypothetical protein